MALTFGSTLGAGVDRLKILVHGRAGVGKTRLAATTPGEWHTLVIGAESGELSLRDHDIQTISVGELCRQLGKSSVLDGMRAFYLEARNGGLGDVQCLFIDSVSEIAEMALAEELKKVNDPRRAYGEMQTAVDGMIKALRSLPMHVVMVAKQDIAEVDAGQHLKTVLMPGKQLAKKLPYLFDEVFAMHAFAPETEGEPVRRHFQTAADLTCDAKDRSGALDFWEPADLAHVHAKIANHNQQPIKEAA